MDNLKKRLTNKKRGFTLVELLVVIAIIAILSVTAYVAMGGQTGKARNSRRQQDLGSIQNALEVYFVENYSKYPDALKDDSNAATGPELAPKYMPKIPVDPIPQAGGVVRDYVYKVDSTHKFYQLATTLEQEDGKYKAYVIGNSATPLVTSGDFDDSCAPASCNVVDGGATCLPYCP